MFGPLQARFRPRRDGSIDINIADEERELVGELVQQMRELLMSTSAEGAVDPSMRRLYPTAYADDPERDAEYQKLMRNDLLQSKFENLETVERTLAAKRLDADEAQAWLTSINDTRLVLGTKLDVSEDEDFNDFRPDDPEQGPRAVYHYLGHLLGEIVDVLEY